MLLAGILSAALLAGCGSSAASSGTATSSSTAATSSAGTSVSSTVESTGASSASSTAASEASSTDSSSGSDALTPVKANEPYSIDVIYKTTFNEYTKYLMAGVQAAANDAGVTVEQKGATSETAYEEQQNMIETDLVSNKFDAMVVIPLQGDIVSTLVANTSIPIFAMDTDFNSEMKRKIQSRPSTRWDSRKELYPTAKEPMISLRKIWSAYPVSKSRNRKDSECTQDKMKRIKSNTQNRGMRDTMKNGIPHLYPVLPELTWYNTLKSKHDSDRLIMGETVHMGDPEKKIYLPMAVDDGTGISIEHWQDSWSVDFHNHEYCELILVDKGSCDHFYKNTDTLLIPGDVVFINENYAHAYALHGEISLYNCQFRPEELDDHVVKRLVEVGILDAPESSASSSGNSAPKNYESQRRNMAAKELPSLAVNSSKQGVIHLTPSEKNYFIMLIEHIMLEQENEHPTKLLKQKYLEILLLELRNKIRMHSRMVQNFSKENQMIIAEVLANIEADITKDFDINATAERYGFSPNYFRTLFKNVTGLSPVQYVNRARIMLSCEMLEKEGATIKEAAEEVGIYDLNYFSRLFKKIIGCSPNKI